MYGTIDGFRLYSEKALAFHWNGNGFSLKCHRLFTAKAMARKRGC